MQEVGGSIPPGSTKISIASPSSRGPGHRPFTAVTGVRIPLGTPAFPTLRQNPQLRRLVRGRAARMTRLPPRLPADANSRVRPLFPARNPAALVVGIRSDFREQLA